MSAPKRVYAVDPASPLTAVYLDLGTNDSRFGVRHTVVCCPAPRPPIRLVLHGDRDHKAWVAQQIEGRRRRLSIISGELARMVTESGWCAPPGQIYDTGECGRWFDDG